MQESPELQKERALSRRTWTGCLLTFAVAGAIILLISALPLGIFKLQSQPVPVLAALAIAGLGATLLLGIGGMVLILRITFWSMEGARQKHQRGTEVLQRTLPGVAAGPVIQEHRFSVATLGKQTLWLFLFVIGLSIALFVVNLAIMRLLPDAPGITSLVVVFGLVAVAAQLRTLQMQRQRTTPSMAGEPSQGRPLVAGLLYTLVIIVPTLGVIPLISFVSLPGVLSLLVTFGACVLVFLTANVAYVFVPIFWIQEAVKRCDYDGGLARARLTIGYSFMPGFYRNLGGVILLWAGRYVEARAMFEQSIGESRKEALGAGSAALENIGCALAWQGKYDEAIPMFEGSIAISQNEVMVYSDLAEVYLRQGTSIPRALELTGRAVENNQHAPWEIRLLAGYQAGQVLATRAWALAAAGRRKEAVETLALAFSKADKSFKPVLAGIYWRAGRVMLALDEPGRAKEYFERGRQIDPRGHYGRLCTEAMVG